MHTLTLPAALLSIENAAPRALKQWLATHSIDTAVGNVWLQHGPTWDYVTIDGTYTPDRVPPGVLNVTQNHRGFKNITYGRPFTAQELDAFGLIPALSEAQQSALVTWLAQEIAAKAVELENVRQISNTTDSDIVRAARQWDGTEKHSKYLFYVGSKFHWEILASRVRDEATALYARSTPYGSKIIDTLQHIPGLSQEAQDEVYNAIAEATDNFTQMGRIINPYRKNDTKLVNLRAYLRRYLDDAQIWKLLKSIDVDPDQITYWKHIKYPNVFPKYKPYVAPKPTIQAILGNGEGIYKDFVEYIAGIKSKIPSGIFEPIVAALMGKKSEARIIDGDMSKDSLIILLNDSMRYKVDAKKREALRQKIMDSAALEKISEVITNLYERYDEARSIAYKTPTKQTPLVNAAAQPFPVDMVAKVLKPLFPSSEFLGAWFVHDPVTGATFVFHERQEPGWGMTHIGVMSSHVLAPGHTGFVQDGRGSGMDNGHIPDGTHYSDAVWKEANSLAEALRKAPKIYPAKKWPSDWHE
jgi:hypothetical protein